MEPFPQLDAEHGVEPDRRLVEHQHLGRGDEPTVGLDPVLRVELWDRFHALARAGTTLIVSSHVMDEAGRCDRLLLLRAGDLLADSTPAQLRADGRSNDLEEAFLNVVRAREEVAA